MSEVIARKRPSIDGSNAVWNYIGQLIIRKRLFQNNPNATGNDYTGKTLPVKCPRLNLGDGHSVYLRGNPYIRACPCIAVISTLPVATPPLKP